MATKEVGFVKAYRHIMESPLWYEDSKRFKIYFTILLTVNWKANSFRMLNGERHNLQPGQTITSYSKIAERSGSNDISYKVVRNACKYLHDEGYICMETTPRKNIKISLLNWDQEQGKHEQIDRIDGIVGNQYLDRAQDRAQETGILLEAETPTRKALPAPGVQIGAQDGAQDRALIEEVQRRKEEEEEIAKSMPTDNGDLSTGEVKNAAAIIPIKEKEEAGASPDTQIINLYHKIKKEYHLENQVVNINKDIATLKKSDNRTMIIDDGPEKVDRKIRGWFDNTNDRNYEWKKDNNFPFAAFCKQYHSIREVERVKYFADTCRECGGTLHQYEGGGMEEHICSHMAICHHCNTGIPYKGKKRDEAILQEHRERAGCNAPEG